MKFQKESIGRRWVPYTIAACSAVVLYVILSHLGILWDGIKDLFSFFSPVLGAIIIAYIIDALVVLFERSVFRRIKRRRSARILSIVFAIIVILLLLGLFTVALIPQLADSVTALFNNLSGYVTSLVAVLNNADFEIAGFHFDLSAFIEYGNNLLRNLTTTLQENIGRIINTSYTIGKGFMNSVICFILAIYILVDKERLLSLCRHVMHHRLNEEQYGRTAVFLHRCNHILIRYIACDLLDGVIVGVVNFIFMQITGMPYAVLISVLVAVANLVPTFGPVFGGVIGAFILLLVNPNYVLWFLIFTVILQTFDGYLLKPKLYGDTLGVSSLWILVSLIVGGRIFGTVGLLLSIPFAAISDFVFRSLIRRRIIRHEGETDSAPVDNEEEAQAEA